MAKNQKTKQSNTDAVPTLNPIEIQSGEQLTWSPSEGTLKYVVTRNGIRVSDKEYASDNEDAIIDEFTFWKNVVSKFPDGTKIQIVQYDKKKHRIW